MQQQNTVMFTKINVLVVCITLIMISMCIFHSKKAPILLLNIAKLLADDWRDIRYSSQDNYQWIMMHCSLMHKDLPCFLTPLATRNKPKKKKTTTKKTPSGPKGSLAARQAHRYDFPRWFSHPFLWKSCLKVPQSQPNTFLHIAFFLTEFKNETYS